MSLANKSQATRDGRSSSASRFTLVDPARLSSGRLGGYTFMKIRHTTVIAVVLGLLAVSWLTNRTFAQTSTNRSASSPALQKAKMIKMDSFMVENLTLDQVIDTLNQQVALRHGGVELRLAATAKEKEKTLITVSLKKTSLAEILDRVAKAADLNLRYEPE